jgi:hypothetical protein
VKRVKRTLAPSRDVRQIEFSSVVRAASVERLKITEPQCSEQSVVSSDLPVKRCVPVASVKRQLSPVVSQFVASASPRDVLLHGLHERKRAAATKKFKRTLERLAKPSKSVTVALCALPVSSVVLH